MLPTYTGKGATCSLLFLSAMLYKTERKIVGRIVGTFRRDSKQILEPVNGLKEQIVAWDKILLSFEEYGNKLQKGEE